MDWALTSRLLLCGVSLGACRDAKERGAPTDSGTGPTVRAAAPAPRGVSAPEACAASLLTLHEGPREVSIGSLSATREGAKLFFRRPAAQEPLRLGVLASINEASSANLIGLRRYASFFRAEQVHAVLAAGDIGEDPAGIHRALAILAELEVPVLVIPGNRECMPAYREGLSRAQRAWSNVIDMTDVRTVNFPALTVLSMPGHHDPAYLTCEDGCRYTSSSLAEVLPLARSAPAPVLLFAHNPPRGLGAQALDYAAVGGNLGDPQLARFLRESEIPFGIFSDIKEAGARATADVEGRQVLAPSVPSRTLYLNPGPADTIEWRMNDGTRSNGMAALLVVHPSSGATFKVYRGRPVTAAERAEAQRQELRDQRDR